MELAKNHTIEWKSNYLIGLLAGWLADRESESFSFGQFHIDCEPVLKTNPTLTHPFSAAVFTCNFRLKILNSRSSSNFGMNCIKVIAKIAYSMKIISTGFSFSKKLSIEMKCARDFFCREYFSNSFWLLTGVGLAWFGIEWKFSDSHFIVVFKHFHVVSFERMLLYIYQFLLVLF